MSVSMLLERYKMVIRKETDSVQRVSEQQSDGNPCNGSKGRSSHNPGVDRTLSPCILSSQGKLGTSEPE